MSARITGPVLSALLYEHSSADNDMEGLLLGTVTDVIKDTISDTSMSNVQRQKLYSVFSFIPCSIASPWYDSKMVVLDERMKNLLHGFNKGELIGWFKLRRNSSMRVSMKERSISNHLLEWLRRSETSGNSSRDLLFMLCTSQYSLQTALFSCDHMFMVFDGRTKFACIPETVTNLAESMRTCYRQPIGQVTSPLCSYTRVLDKFKSTFIDENKDSGVVGDVRQLYKKLHSKLKSLSGSVDDSEQQLARELAELIALRQRLAACQEAVDDTMDALQSSSIDAATVLYMSNEVPYSNTDSGSPQLLLSQHTNVDTVPTTLKANDAIPLLDNDHEVPDAVPCLLPIPAAAVTNTSATAVPTNINSKAYVESFDSVSDLINQQHCSSFVEQSVSANGVDAKPPAQSTKIEPFGFVNDILTNHKSPVKTSNVSLLNTTTSSDRRNVNVAKPMQANAAASSSRLQTVAPSASIDSDDDDDECI